MSFTPPEPLHHVHAAAGRFLLWIDGAGAYLVCLAERVTVGGPRFDDQAADLSLLAGLSRRHVTLVRGEEGYWIEAHAAAKVNGRPVLEGADLTDGCEIELGENVRLRFRLPTPLSNTAVLDFVSDHRPQRSVDGVVLMADTCLLGTGEGNHVRCPDWPETVVLFRRDGAFWCRSRGTLCVGSEPVRGPARIEPGDIISGPESRFRLEALDL